MNGLASELGNGQESPVLRDYSDRIIKPGVLESYMPHDSTGSLLEQQITGFTRFLHSEEAPTAFSDGYSQLRNLDRDPRWHNGIEEQVQFNPARERNIKDFLPSAKKNTSCFLCPENMAEDEVGFWFGDRLIFGNLFPYLFDHLVIVETSHAPQQLESQLPAAIQIALEAPDRFFLYNGPEVGATAPVHPHGQSGRKTEFPVLRTIAMRQRINSGEKVVLDTGIDPRKAETYIPLNIGRSMLVVRSFEPEDMLAGIVRSIEVLKQVPDTGLIDINFGIAKLNNVLTSVIYPRTAFRHSKFYDDNGLKSTPAASEFTGFWPLPVKKQFAQVTGAELQATLADVSVAQEKLRHYAGKHALARA